MNRTVTLSDEKGAPLGEADIIEAHTGKGKLHRAMSVYVFDAALKNVLIQQRSAEKMLFAGIWANAACSHPFPGESATAAGERRLKEEMGFTCAMTEGPAFVYRAEDPNGKGVEHEYDIILVGTYDPKTPITPDPKEVQAYKWIDIDKLQEDMKNDPTNYAVWFHIGLPQALSFAHGRR